MSLEDTMIDQPFGKTDPTTIARHMRTKKWFAALMEKDGKTWVNLKCDPFEAEFLRARYTGVTPGYHMNKRHWISVSFNSDVSDDALKAMTMESYNLTYTKPPKVKLQG